MNPLNKIVVWVFVAAVVSAISIGCTTGPEKKPGSSYENEKKSEEPLGY
jgi:hypothetical protein